MKKISAVFAACLTLSVLFSGCGNKDQGAPEALIQPINEPAPPAVEKLPEAAGSAQAAAPDSALNTDMVQPPEAGMVRSRLTNEWVSAELANTRPIAIMVPNSKTASQYGLSQASVLYECNVEGSMTRLMGIWGDWTNLEKVGNIRSARDYYIYWAFEWDAIYIHFGGPFYIDEVSSRSDTQNINCLSYSGGAFRATAKNSTDNAFTSTEYIKGAIQDFDYPLAYRSGYADEYHYRFAPGNAPNILASYTDALTADTIDMSPAYPLTNCYFKYNAATGLYYRYQHLSGESNGPHIDMANGEQLTFKNILIQNTYFELRDQKGYLAFQCNDTSRDGWFFTNGKGIHVNWKKNSDYGATRYYDDQGREIELNTGKTMVCILEDGDDFLVDGRKIS